MLLPLQNLESLVAHNTVSPVFYPRLYHLMAYVCTLMGDMQNCDLFLNTALQLSETQGNELEKCWLNISKVCTASCQLGWGVPTLLSLLPAELGPGTEAITRLPEPP